MIKFILAIFNIFTTPISEAEVEPEYTEEYKYWKWWSSQDIIENPPPVHPKFDEQGKRLKQS